MRLTLELVAGAILAWLAVGGIAPLLVSGGASERLVMTLTVVVIAVVEALVVYVEVRKRRREARRPVH